MVADLKGWSIHISYPTTQNYLVCHAKLDRVGRKAHLDFVGYTQIINFWAWTCKYCGGLGPGSYILALFYVLLAVHS